MTLEMFDIGVLILLSIVCSILISGVKHAILLSPWAHLEDTKAWRPLLRAFSVVFGVVLVVLAYDFSLLSVCIGVLAGHAAESVYRWYLRQLADRFTVSN